MALNYIFIGFFVIAFVVGLLKLTFWGDTEVFSAMMEATWTKAESAFHISLYLTGALTLWMGLMRVGEKGGAVKVIAKVVGPFFHKLFPEVPKDHPANGSIIMNFSANMLGLDNAATPLGLKAMEHLQELNPKKDTASNAQIMFLVLNTSGLTLIPVSVMVIRAEEGALDPADVFLPILLATFFSSLVGLLITAIYQRINILDKVILAYLGGISAVVTGTIYGISTLPQDQVGPVSGFAANILLLSIIVSFISLAAYKKVNVYEEFIEGAKGGFQVAVKIIPYLVAILVGVGVFTASGAMAMVTNGLETVVLFLGFNADFVPAMPTAFMKPLSGGGARGMMVQAIQEHGVDSFVGRVASTFQGSTETTFYTLAVYFGAVNIRKTRYTVVCGLIADAAGITAAILLGYLFFH